MSDFRHGLINFLTIHFTFTFKNPKSTVHEKNLHGTELLSLTPSSHMWIQNQQHKWQILHKTWRRFTQMSLLCCNGPASESRSHSRAQMAHKAEKRGTSIALTVITMCFYWPWHFEGIGNTCLLTFRVWITWDISCLCSSPFMNRSVQRASAEWAAHRADSKYSHAVKDECERL